MANQQRPGLDQLFCGWCQTNPHWSLVGQGRRPLFGAKAAPLGESSIAVQFEIGAGVEAAFLVEVVVDRGMYGGEFLQCSHPPEAEHGPLPSSKRLV